MADIEHYGSPIVANEDNDLPEGWELLQHNTGVTLFFHLNSKAISVTKPYQISETTLLSVKDHKIPKASIPSVEHMKILLNSDIEDNDVKQDGDDEFTYTYITPLHLQPITTCNSMELRLSGTRHYSILKQFCSKCFAEASLDLDVIEGPERMDKSLAEFSVVVRVGNHILGGGMGNSWEEARINAVTEALCFVLPSETARWRNVEPASLSELDNRVAASVSLRRLEPSYNFKNVMYYECAVKIRALQFSYARDKSHLEALDSAIEQAVKVLVPDLDRWTYQMCLHPKDIGASESILQESLVNLSEGHQAFSNAWRETEQIKLELRFLQRACTKIMPPPKPLYDRLEGMRRILNKRVADLENQMSMIRQTGRVAGTDTDVGSGTNDDAVAQALKELRAKSVIEGGSSTSSTVNCCGNILIETTKDDVTFSTIPTKFDEDIPAPNRLLEILLVTKEGRAPEALKDEHRMAGGDFADYVLSAAGYSVKLGWTKDQHEAKMFGSAVILKKLFPEVSEYKDLVQHIMQFKEDHTDSTKVESGITKAKCFEAPSVSVATVACPQESPSVTAAIVDTKTSVLDSSLSLNENEECNISKDITPEKAESLLMKIPLDEENYSAMFSLCKVKTEMDPLMLLEDYLQSKSNKPGRQWDETFAVDKNNDKVKLVLNTRFKASELGGLKSVIEVEVEEKNKKRARRKACIKLIGMLFPGAKAYGEVWNIVQSMRKDCPKRINAFQNQEYVSTFKEVRARAAREDGEVCAAYPDKVKPRKKRSLTPEFRRRKSSDYGGKSDHWQHDDRSEHRVIRNPSRDKDAYKYGKRDNFDRDLELHRSRHSTDRHGDEPWDRDERSRGHSFSRTRYHVEADSSWHDEEALYDAESSYSSGHKKKRSYSPSPSSGSRHKRQRDCSPSRRSYSENGFEKLTLDDSEAGGWIRGNSGSVLVFNDMKNGDIGVAERGTREYKLHIQEHDLFHDMDHYERETFRDVIFKMQSHLEFHYEKQSRR